MEPNQTSGPGTSGPHWPPQTHSRSLSDTIIHVFDSIKTLFSFVGQSGLSICKVYLRARIFFVLENQSCQCTAPLFIFFHFSWEHTSQIKALFVQTFNKKSSALTQLEKCPLSPSTLSSVPRVNDEDSKAINRLAVKSRDQMYTFKVSDAWGKWEKVKWN